ncbi:MAG: Wzz/FepE/Etk N-terminal domain-containing protein [Synergistaceae bacterium]|nr:Wzz/FepE/Etk N-terminal domain-containing protein [Synergistaceae bacterium]
MDKETHPVMRNDFDGWRDDSEIDLVDIIDSLWKHKKLIAAFIAVCLICASAYLTVTPRSFRLPDGDAAILLKAARPCSFCLLYPPR